MPADEFGLLFERFKAMPAPYAARMHVAGDGAADS